MIEHDAVCNNSNTAKERDEYITTLAEKLMVERGYTKNHATMMARCQYETDIEIFREIDIIERNKR